MIMPEREEEDEGRYTIWGGLGEEGARVEGVLRGAVTVATPVSSFTSEADNLPSFADLSTPRPSVKIPIPSRKLSPRAATAMLMTWSS